MRWHWGYNYRFSSNVPSSNAGCPKRIKPPASLSTRFELKIFFATSSQLSSQLATPKVAQVFLRVTHVLFLFLLARRAALLLVELTLTTEAAS